MESSGIGGPNRDIFRERVIATLKDKSFQISSCAIALNEMRVIDVERTD